MGELEPIDPSTAVELYLKERATDLAESTLKAHEYRLSHFIRWVTQEGLENLNDLTGRDLHRYKLWRQADGDLNKVTLKTQMDTLRVFIKWAESIDAVPIYLHEKVLSPTLNGGEGKREVMLSSEAAGGEPVVSKSPEEYIGGVVTRALTKGVPTSGVPSLSHARSGAKEIPISKMMTDLISERLGGRPERSIVSKANKSLHRLLRPSIPQGYDRPLSFMWGDLPYPRIRWPGSGNSC